MTAAEREQFINAVHRAWSRGFFTGIAASVPFAILGAALPWLVPLFAR